MARANIAIDVDLDEIGEDVGRELVRLLSGDDLTAIDQDKVALRDRRMGEEAVAVDRAWFDGNGG